MTSIVVTKHEDPVSAALNAVDAAVDSLLCADVTSWSTRELREIDKKLATPQGRCCAGPDRRITGTRPDIPGGVPDGETVSDRGPGDRTAPSAAQRPDEA